MPTIVDVFDAVEIKNAAVLFKGETASSPFGCVGKLDAETEIKSISKLCGGVIQKKKSKPSSLTVTISGHMQLKVLRDIFGISNTGLITDVYAYGIDSIGKDFSFVAEENDIFEGNKRLIAFPNCAAATGYVKSVENGAEELAEFELEITALPDVNGKLYYEGVNLTGTVATNWMTKFDPASLKSVTP